MSRHPLNERAAERIRYRRVSSRIWNDEKFRALSTPQPNGQSLWCYFIFGPKTTIVPGIVLGGQAAHAEELGWPLEAFREAFQELETREMATSDWRNRIVWLPNGIAHNAPESPNVCIQWHRAFRDEFPACDLTTTAKRRILKYLNAIHEVHGQPVRYFAEAFAEAFEQGRYTPLRKGGGTPFTESGTGTGTGTGVHTRGRLVTPPKEYRHLAFLSTIGKHVPNFLHEEFRLQVISAKGLDEGTADRQLLTWYQATDAAWTGKPAGDDPTKFWRARFAEWIGTSAAAPAPPRGGAVRTAAETAAYLRRLREGATA